MSILQGQRDVFKHLGIELVQERADQVPHGDWMEDVLSRHQSDDIVVFCDIDAFPLRRDAYLAAVQHARSGCVFGLAQFSNHKKTREIYAGPMFMAFRKSCWESVGRPGMKSNKQFDAAESLSVKARELGVPLVMSSPTASLIPKWALADKGVFGIGTFYGSCDFFHLFESRKPQYEKIFDAVVMDVIGDHPLNFDNYLSLAQVHHTGQEVAPRSRSWVPKPLRRFLRKRQ
jgi:hypothetical protein